MLQSTSTVTFDPKPISVGTLLARILVNHDLYKTYMIHHIGEIVGFCFLSQFKKHESYKRTAELGVYLKPEHTGRGLGTKAVEHLKQVAVKKGLKVLVASISGENEGSSGLFRKLRWEKCAHFRKVGEKWGRAIDVICFQKSLEND